MQEGVNDVKWKEAGRLYGDIHAKYKGSDWLVGK